EEEARPEACPVQDERLPRRAGGRRERDAGDLARRRRARVNQKERHCEQHCEEGPQGWLRLTAVCRRTTAPGAGAPSSPPRRSRKGRTLRQPRGPLTNGRPPPCGARPR